MYLYYYGVNTWGRNESKKRKELRELKAIVLKGFLFGFVVTLLAGLCG